MRKLLTLIFLLLPATVLADRLGGINSNTSVLLSTQGIQNTNSLQNGSTFYVNQGNVDGSLFINGTNASNTAFGSLDVTANKSTFSGINPILTIYNSAGFPYNTPYISAYNDTNGARTLIGAIGMADGIFSLDHTGTQIFSATSQGISLSKGGNINNTATNVLDTSQKFIFYSTMTLTGNRVVRDVTPTNSQVLTWNNANSYWEPQAAQASTNLKRNSVEYVISGGGSAIGTGSKGFLSIEYSCTVSSWTILADQSGSIVVDIKRSTYAGFPTTTSIIGGGNLPTLSSQQKNTAVPASWTSTAITEGDILEYNVNSATTVQRVVVSMKCDKT